LIFTRSATESINLVARGWLQARLQPGDEVWVTRMEHHANFLPWQAVCNESGARLRVIELTAQGTLDWEACVDKLFSTKTKLIAVTQVSNVLGVINPLTEIIRRAHEQDIAVLVDAAQAVGHIPVDVSALDCDFLALSAHKLFGPNGIGALFAKAEHLQSMEPLLLGGGMVDVVGETHSEWAEYPAKFEAGSPNLADALGFAVALDYIEAIGLDVIQAHVNGLTQYALDKLSAIEGLHIYGPADVKQQTGIISFNVGDVHSHDLGQIAGEHNVAIRAGHHCCQPLMEALGVAATARVSFAPYNTREDVDALLEAIEAARQVFG
jgi:cysteine desulfurase/selenocysteine lyase